MNFIVYYKGELTQKPNQNRRIKEFNHRKNQAMEVIDPKFPERLNECTQDEIYERSTVESKSCYKEDLNRSEQV